MGGLTIVTGGTGFIGAALVRMLLERGGRVRMLVLPGRENESLSRLGAELAEGDVRDYSSLVKAFSGGRVLYHLAALTDLWSKDSAVFEEVNFRGTLNVLQAAATAGTFERIVYTSSATVIGPDPTRPGEYSFLPDLRKTPGPYSRSKLRAGHAVQAAAANGLPVVVVAPTLPLGPGDFRLTPPTWMLLQFLNGSIRALLECKLNFVDIRDVASGHLQAADQGTLGRVYPLAGTNLLLSDMFCQAAELTGLPSVRCAIPYGAGLLFALLNQSLSAISGRPPMATVAGVRMARRGQWFDNRRTREDLGTSFRPFRQTLRDAVGDLLERGLVRRPVHMENR